MTFAPPVLPALWIEGLAKAFDGRPAVAGLDLRVARGSFFGLVGPNGAGKTTTLRMATGLLRPDAGRVRIDGVDVWPDPQAAKLRLGIVPDGLPLFDRLTGGELLQYAGLLRGLDDDEVDRRVDALLDLLGLETDRDKLVVDYSHGMKKKVALGAALIHRPSVLVLDEPFEGVDPVSAVAVRRALERFTAAGGTVVLSSHLMDLVERLCDHVAVIADGRILAHGSIDELRHGGRLEDAFIDIVGGEMSATAGLDWLDA